MEKAIEDLANLSLQDKEEVKYTLDDFELLRTVGKLSLFKGTGSFGRVWLVWKKGDDKTPYALKLLKKSDVIRLR